MLLLQGIKSYLEKPKIVISGMLFGGILTLIGKDGVLWFLFHFGMFSLIIILTLMQNIHRENKSSSS